MMTIGRVARFGADRPGTNANNAGQQKKSFVLKTMIEAVGRQLIQFWQVANYSLSRVSYSTHSPRRRTCNRGLAQGLFVFDRMKIRP
ncbi:hypothetical protein MnTg02_02252 [bacterium MnTg02]|nr:hypothetical protein MnTg02_02252 [bacterium MnTg02]